MAGPLTAGIWLEEIRTGTETGAWQFANTSRG